MSHLCSDGTPCLTDSPECYAPFAGLCTKKQIPETARIIQLQTKRRGKVAPSPVLHTELSKKTLAQERTTPGLDKPLGEWSFVTREQLVADTRTLARELPADIDMVIAIARSGFLPGADIATYLHLPLKSVSQSKGVVDFGHGGRMIGADHFHPKHLLLIDDTAARGIEMNACFSIVRDTFPDAKIIRAVVYCHPLVTHVVDLYVRAYPGKHYLEWNFLNAGHGETAVLDFDGILVPDMVPPEWTIEAITEMQRNQPPLYLPRRSVVPMICTGRGEDCRESSEYWLRKHGVRWNRLVMRPESVGHDHESIATFKAGHYAESECTLFVESSVRQSKIIAKLTGKMVLCPKAGLIIPALAQEPATYSPEIYALARSCVDRGCKTGCQYSVCNKFNKEAHFQTDCLPCRLLSTQVAGATLS